MTRFVVLLRGINVGASRKLPMGELARTLKEQGFPDAQTYIASGNLILSATGRAAAIEERIEALIAMTFGLKTEAIAREAGEFAKIVAHNPFPDALPKLLHLGLAKHPVRKAAPDELAPRAIAGERIALAGGGLWIDFADSGVAKSKLTPAVLDKAAGSTLTARNWNTAQKLVELSKA